MTFKTVIANRVHQPVLRRLEAHGPVEMNTGDTPWSAEDLAQRSGDAEALMAFMTETVDAAFLARCPDLRIVAGALKGYNNIDVDACTERGVAVSIVPDLLTEPTAELTIGLMIGIARNLGPGDRLVRGGGFEGWRPAFYGGSINGATVGIIGAGAVGRSVMRQLSGFRCTRLYVDTRPLSSDQETDLGAERVDLHDLLARADFVVLAVHLMADTHGFVDAGFLRRMKEGAYLINPARGSLVDEVAVAAALKTGHLAGYAADTFAFEDWACPDRPAGIHSDLLNSERTLLTPHIGSAVTRVRQAIENSAADSILAVAGGTLPETVVNRTKLLETAWP